MANVALVVVAIKLDRCHQLLVIVKAYYSVGLLLNSLQNRQQDRDQDRDDGNDHQQFHQRKRATTVSSSHNGLGICTYSTREQRRRADGNILPPRPPGGKQIGATRAGNRIVTWITDRNILEALNPHIQGLEGTPMIDRGMGGRGF